ncbi:MAG: transposase [Nautiliaceae bacterium]
MARKPRVSEPGFYHIVNRGVERKDIFNEKEDYIKFLELMLKTKYDYNVTFHAFTILPNHYHILIETHKDNLSEAMRFLNSAYAAWYNFKNNRVGHLWKGRFESYMLFDEKHFWNIIKYIERNAFVLGLVDDITKWEYQSLYLRLNKNRFSEIIEGSKIFEKPLDEYIEWLKKPLEKFEIEEIYKEPKIIKDENGNIKVVRKRLEEFFKEYEDKKEAIKAAKAHGYKYSEIARFLGYSNAYISKLAKS